MTRRQLHEALHEAGGLEKDKGCMCSVTAIHIKLNSLKVAIYGKVRITNA